MNRDWYETNNFATRHLDEIRRKRYKGWSKKNKGKVLREISSRYFVIDDYISNWWSNMSDVNCQMVSLDICQ